MSFFCRILYWIAMSFCTIWFLLLLLLKLLLFPVLFFLPATFIEKFDETVTKIALKILRIIWHVIKCCFFIMFGLVITLLTPILIIWAPLCGTLWSWTVSGGEKITLETKKRVYLNLFKFGVVLIILFCMLGLAIGCISGEFLAPIVGGVAGFILWIFPTVDCYDLYEKIEKELNFSNRPYDFVDSSSSQKILFTVKSSAPPPECAKDSDSASPPLSFSESDCCGNDSPSRPGT